MSDVLVDYVTERAGDSLRALARYDSEGPTVLHCRTGVDQGAVRELLAAVHERLTWEWHPGDDDVLDRVGILRATVHVYEDDVIINLPVAPDRGALVCLDLESARNLDRFIADCRGHLQ